MSSLNLLTVLPTPLIVSAIAYLTHAEARQIIQLSRECARKFNYEKTKQYLVAPHGYLYTYHRVGKSVFTSDLYQDGVLKYTMQIDDSMVYANIGVALVD